MTAAHVERMPRGGGKAAHERVDRWRWETYGALCVESPALLNEVLCGRMSLREADARRRAGHTVTLYGLRVTFGETVTIEVAADA